MSSGQLEPSAGESNTNTRPRRQVRPAKRLPEEYTSVSAPAVGGASGEASAANGSRGGKGKGRAKTKTKTKGRGKREVEEDEEDGVWDEDFMEVEDVPHGNASGSEKAKSKSKSKKLYDLDFILTSSKSPLVSLDILERVLNYQTWCALSEESRARLCKLLPPTAFGILPQRVDDFHPSRRGQGGGDDENENVNAMQVDTIAAVGAENALDPLFFTDPHFESAAKTFQDHLFTGWLTRSHSLLVEKYLRGVQEGTMHAPWKDEKWDRDHPDIAEGDEGEDVDDEASQDPSGFVSIGRMSKRKGSDLLPLIRKDFLKVGDIIAFKHKFIVQNITVEKDTLVAEVNVKTGMLGLQALTGAQRSLPPSLLIPSPSTLRIDGLREMSINSAYPIATALLDLDGRVPRDARPRFDAWKAMTVWRWPTDDDSIGKDGMTEEVAALLKRGGREVLGTLYYLRGAALE